MAHNACSRNRERASASRCPSAFAQRALPRRPPQTEVVATATAEGPIGEGASSQATRRRQPPDLGLEPRRGKGRAIAWRPIEMRQAPVMAAKIDTRGWG